MFDHYFMSIISRKNSVKMWLFNISVSLEASLFICQPFVFQVLELFFLYQPWHLLSTANNQFLQPRVGQLGEDSSYLRGDKD